MTKNLRLAPTAVLIAAALALPAVALSSTTTGRIGPDLRQTGNGRLLDPAGRLTQLGNFPSGAALSPDGRFLWAIDSGHGADDVKVVDVGSGAVVQTLPLPGAYGGVAFAPDGRRAYVSGEPASDANPPPPAEGPMMGTDGDVVHVYDVDPGTGHATEQPPFALPATQGTGSGQLNSLPPASKSWPEGLAVTPDGNTLVVALNQADQVAIVDTATGSGRLVDVGRYPFGVAITPDGHTAIVSNEYDGTLSFVDIAAGKQTGTVGVGGAGGDLNAHPEALAVDMGRNLVYAAVANRDLVAAVDLATRKVVDSVSVARRSGPGTQPVGLALAPDGNRLYAADEGEDALAAIDLRTSSMRLAGKIPTAAFPTAAAVTPNGHKLLWVAAKGFGAGPNTGFVFDGAKSPSGNVQTPYGEYVPDKLLGYAGTLDVPDGKELRKLDARAERQAIPVNAEAAPVGTPLRADGPIKHVFYVVRENRTYDQIFGSDPRGDGDPSLELFDDNGVAGPTGGITPNAHALARRFPLLDHFYADSEVSVDGHLIADGGIAIDYAQRALHSNYSGRGRAYDFGIYPVTFGPRFFVLDQAAEQGVSFRNYGEGVGVLPTGAAANRPQYAKVLAGTDTAYPANLQIGCLFGGANSPGCTRDSSATLSGPVPGFALVSRMEQFARQFAAQDAAGQVPAFNFVLLPNDHTNGTTSGDPTPQAEIADNDLALGQLVDVISHSSIWNSSAIIVTEDDSQDGADHIDAHRMPAFVVSPWAVSGEVPTRYDQYSALRTAEILAGLQPLSINDALATPMYDAFRNDGQPDAAPYSAIVPGQPLTATNGSSAPDAKLSGTLPFDKVDQVPQALLDRILWHAVRGASSTPPAPGPNASPDEHERAVEALRILARGGNVRAYLGRTADDG